MREIKFRTWDKRYNEMIYDAHKTYDYGCCNTGSTHHQSFDCILEDENCEVMQYIGLKDKNGKEIYEGDILSINVAGVVTKKTKVVYENGIFGVYWRVWNSPYKEINSFNSFCNTEFEVIGNIFENPELLGDD